MKWVEFQVDADREAAETIAELFHRHGQGGVAIEEDVEGLPDRDGYRIKSDTVRISTYLPENADVAPARLAIEQALWHIRQIRPVGELRTRLVDEADWANAWKEHFHVHHVGQRTVIRPTWRDYTPQPGEVVLDLDPGMAFGTGLHPTTRLCLEAIEQVPLDGRTVLDVGSGSGILTIAAAKHGARRIVAIDVDPIAVTATAENAARNGIQDRVEVHAGSIGPSSTAWLDRDDVHERDATVLDFSSQQFDLVLANLVAQILIDLAPYFRPLLAPGGILLASGIIEDRVEDVRGAFRDHGLMVVDERSENDWYLLRCTAST